ncbi:unnamed protein product [Euphydryas editha]|uniref:Uncharacterized protein n=1 Tax=Euphydryas editha TaxID=104508 RepID=A0AAU9VB25_EUPED|nr:unnamed protein product [Euphydryas editha]
MDTKKQKALKTFRIEIFESLRRFERTDMSDSSRPGMKSIKTIQEPTVERPPDVVWYDQVAHYPTVITINFLQYNYDTRKTKRRDDPELQDAFHDFEDEIRRILHATKNEIGQEIKNHDQLLLQDIKENLDMLTTDTEELRREVAGITREFSVIKEEFASLRASVEFTSNQYDGINKKLSSLSNVIKNLNFKD